MKYYRISFKALPTHPEDGDIACVVQEISAESALRTARSAIASFYQIAADSLRWLETAEDGIRYLDFLIPHRAYANVWV